MKKLLVLALGLFVTGAAVADNNDFLSDYSLLEPREGNLVKNIYTVPNLDRRMADYKAVLVDQPEIFIASDSRYKGAKGDQLKQLADVARLSTIAQIEAGGFAVADEPGADVLYLRWAITDLYLKKKKRGILTYTPVGMVVHATKSAAVRDLWKKIDIVEFSVEMEISDLVTSEVLGMVESNQQGVRKQDDQDADPVSWQELDAFFETIGARIACKLSNSRLPESENIDCRSVFVEPEYPEEE